MDLQEVEGDAGPAAAAAAAAVATALSTLFAATTAAAAADSFAVCAELIARDGEPEYRHQLLLQDCLPAFKLVLSRFLESDAVMPVGLACIAFAASHQRSYDLRSGGADSTTSLVLRALQLHGGSTATTLSALEVLRLAQPCDDGAEHACEFGARKHFCLCAADAAKVALERHEADGAVFEKALELLLCTVASWTFIDRRRRHPLPIDDIDDGGDENDEPEAVFDVVVEGEDMDAFIVTGPARLARFAGSAALLPVIARGIERHAAVDAVVKLGCEGLAAIYGIDGAEHPFVGRDAAAASHLRGSSGAAAAALATAFDRRFGAAAAGAAAGFAAMDGKDGDSQSATAMLSAMMDIISYEHTDHAGHASATAFAASPALMTLLDVLRHHRRDSNLLITAMNLLEELVRTAAAQADLARADAVGAVAQLLDRQPAAELVSFPGRLTVTTHCIWLLRLLARSSEHDAALLRPSTIVAIMHAMPAQPIPGRYDNGANKNELVGIASAATALHMAASRDHLQPGHHGAVIKHAAPGLEPTLNAWLAVMPAAFPADEPLLLRTQALSELLAAVPAI